jgi:hypothetical protein
MGFGMIDSYLIAYVTSYATSCVTAGSYLIAYVTSYATSYATAGSYLIAYVTSYATSYATSCVTAGSVASV